MKSNVEESCPPLPVVDGYRRVKIEKSNITMRLPSFADIRRRHSEEEGRGCEYVSNLFITYLWHKGKLISEGMNKFKVPDDKRNKVFFNLTGSGYIKDLLGYDLTLHKKRPWRFDSPLAHKRFPLEYYPKFYWDDPNNPSEKSLKSASLDSKWGVRNTRYKSLHNHHVFVGSCAIPPKDKTDLNSRIESDVTKYYAGGCQIIISIAHGEQYISGWARIYANQENNQEGIMEINRIVDAMVEKLQSYKEE